MREFDPVILKKNILELMEKKGVKKKEIETLLSLSQPNVWKCLSPKDKRCFTLEQTFKIAEYLGTTVDALIGNTEKSGKSSVTGLCSLIVSLLKRRDIYHFTHIVDENVYTPLGGYDFDTHKESVKYHAFYFPSYFSPPKMKRYEDQFEEMEYDAKTLGNNLPINQEVNIFLERFIDNFDKYEGGFIDEDTFKVLTEALLQAIVEP